MLRGARPRVSEDREVRWGWGLGRGLEGLLLGNWEGIELPMLAVGWPPILRVTWSFIMAVF